MGRRILVLVGFLLWAVPVWAVPTATPSPTAQSQTGYKPRADYYAYNWYIFANLPVAPGGSFGSTLLCMDCTKTNPAAQGVLNVPPIPCVWQGQQWDCSGGVVWGRCLNVGLVTTSTKISYEFSSCNKITTATTGLTYTFDTQGLVPDENIELDSYISGAITGPLFAISSGSIKWLAGTAPVSSTTSGNVDILYLKWDGTNLIETGEAFGVH